MTKEELRAHCEKQVKMCEEWAKGNGREPSGKIYEEHKLILELLEENEDFQNYIEKANHTNSQLIQLIEKHKMNRDTSDDCVSREKVHYMITGGKYANEDYEQFIDRLVKELENMPSVTPTHGKCKDCTNYVVGALDEEICIRGHELIHKDFYCKDFEKRGSENV